MGGAVDSVTKAVDKVADTTKKVAEKSVDITKDVTGISAAEKFYDKNKKGIEGTAGLIGRGSAAYFTGGLSEATGLGQGITNSFGTRGFGKFGNLASGFSGGNLGGGNVSWSDTLSDWGSSALNGVRDAFVPQLMSGYNPMPADTVLGQTDKAIKASQSQTFAEMSEMKKYMLIGGGVVGVILLVLLMRKK